MLRYALLGLLRDQPDYGYRLKQRFENRAGGSWPLNSSLVYQTLRSLSRGKYITEAGTGQNHGAPQRQLFKITDKGREHLEHWQRHPPRRTRADRDDEMFIYLLLLEPARRDEARDRIEEQQHAYGAEMKRLLDRKRRSREGSLEVLRLEQDLLHLHANAAWLEMCRKWLDEFGEERADRTTNISRASRQQARAGAGN